MDFRDRSPDADAGGTTDTFPDPREADPVQVERYNELFLEANPDVAVRNGAAGEAATMDTPFAKSDAGIDGDPNWKAKFPWLHDPTHGRRWDFDPVELRVLSQENAWVQMMVQSITKEIAETSWTIVESDGRPETDKRLSTAPGEREPVAKDLPDSTAEEIYENLRHPTPNLNYSDAVEMWLRDYLEVGSMVATKAFDDRFYDGDGADLTADPFDIEPLAISPTAPEVWTKEYSDYSGVPSGYYQFSRRSNPGASGQSSRGVAEAQHFDTGEVMWSDNAPATNRAYGSPPTLFVREFLRSLDLAVDQEQNYLSRGSIPSGAWVFEEWDRNQVLEWKEQNAENIKGKPHKSLMFAGRGGDVKFEPMSMNFKELEFTERMKFYARVVSAAFQVPMGVVGMETENVNRATFQGERENFESNTLGPYMQDLERWINDQYLRHFDGYRFELVPGMSETTKEMRSNRVLSEWNADLRSRENAARELGIDLPDDAEDGFKSDVVDEPEPDDGGMFASASDGREGDETDFSDGGVSKDEPLRNTDEWAMFDVQPDAVDALADDLAEDFEELFADVLDDDEIRDAIESMAAPDDNETEKSVSAIARRLRELLTEHDLAESIQTRLEESSVSEAIDAIRRASEQAGEDVDVDEAAIREKLRDRTQTFADSIANDLADDIRETVGDGFAEGKNSREIAADIAEQGDLESGWSGAERIARQELHVATGEARREVAADLGKVEVWETAGDDRVREAHAEMDGKWRRPGEAWVVPYERGTRRESVQGDSEPGIGCRCVTLLVDREDVDQSDHAGSDGV